MTDAERTEGQPTASPQDEEAEWRGGQQAQDRGEEERSSERGWGSKAEDQKESGADDRNAGAEGEKGDRYREQEGPSDRAGSGQGAKKN